MNALLNTSTPKDAEIVKTITVPQVVAPTAKQILVTYKPDLKTEPVSYVAKHGERAGYHLSKDGEAPTYRFFIGTRTILVPIANVLFVEMNL